MTTYYILCSCQLSTVLLCWRLIIAPTSVFLCRAIGNRPYGHLPFVLNYQLSTIYYQLHFSERRGRHSLQTMHWNCVLNALHYSLSTTHYQLYFSERRGRHSLQTMHWNCVLNALHYSLSTIYYQLHFSECRGRRSLQTMHWNCVLNALNYSLSTTHYQLLLIGPGAQFL